MKKSQYIAPSTRCYPISADTIMSASITEAGGNAGITINDDPATSAPAQGDSRSSSNEWDE